MYWRDAISTILQPLLQKPRLGIITDIDGTVSPIASHPDQATITPRNLALLHALQDCLPLVAVITGRSAGDARRMVDLPGVVYLGNHGMERWTNGHGEIAPEAVAFTPALKAAFKDVQARAEPGMVIEDKGATLAINYRMAHDPGAIAAELALFLQGVASKHGLTVFPGRMVFELRPPVSINKGEPLRQLVKDFNLDTAVYLGDDTTDVDAFRMARRLREQDTCYTLGIGVESDEMPPSLRDHADLLVSGVEDVESFLDWLLEARKTSSTCL